MMEKINQLIQDVINNGQTVKAGKWQGVESYKDMNMKVLYNQLLNLPIPMDRVITEAICSPDLPWAENHFQERVGGNPTNPGVTYRYWPYNTFREDNDPYQDGKKFSHTYQERFWPKRAGNVKFKTLLGSREGIEQTDEPLDHCGIRYNYGDLNDVINLLREQPLTRQAYLPIFFPEDTGAVHKQRIPCTLGYHFYIKDNKLDCTYFIRSCDILRHFRNDIYLAFRLTQHVVNELRDINLRTGDLNMYIINLHVFENDIYALNKKENGIRENYKR